MSDLVTVVVDSSFEEEVINTDQPVLVEFGASWCGPCKRQLPILESLAEKYSGKLKVVKIDIDEAPKSTSEFGIKSVPTIVLFNKGVDLDSLNGLSSEEKIKETLLSQVEL